MRLLTFGEGVPKGFENGEVILQFLCPLCRLVADTAGNPTEHLATEALIIAVDNPADLLHEGNGLVRCHTVHEMHALELSGNVLCPDCQ